jgi:hypothetical protein
MTDNESPLDIPVEILGCSPAGKLLKERRNEWLPHGARTALGGVAMTLDGDIMGWVAYGNVPADLTCPSWPNQALPLTLDQIFPASVEIDLAYSGQDWRRAAGAVNARLEGECREVLTRVSLQQVEQAERTVIARHAGEAFRQAQLELQHRLSGDRDLI